jgi:hypothetical protein
VNDSDVSIPCVNSQQTEDSNENVPNGVRLENSNDSMNVGLACGNGACISGVDPCSGTGFDVSPRT